MKVHKMKKILNLRQRGYGLIEVILAIAITLGLIVGGIVLFNQSQLASNTTDASRAVVTISSEARALYRTASDFNGTTATGDELSATNLIAAGGVPANLINATRDGITLPYTGTMAVAPNAANANTFDATISWAPSTNAVSLCNRLAAPVSAGGSGPLGVGYTVTPDCGNATNPAMVATFVR